MGLCLLVALCLLAAAGGCARQVDPAFVSSAAAQALPELHQQQIRDVLAEHFGTPVNPQLMLPDPDSEEDDPALVEAADPDVLQHGAQVYNLRCAGCHGVTGDGNGPAAPHLQPKPRDYRNGVFKFTSTPYGAKPQRADLTRLIRSGAKGTSMPGFRFLPDEDLRAVVEYVIMLSYRGEVERQLARIAELDYDADEEIDPFDFSDTLSGVHQSWEQAASQVVLPVTAQPRYNDESILLGRKAFLNKGCSKCHGDDGRGQTDWLSHEFIAAQEALPEDQRVKINYDAWGQPAPAADLTARMLHGGRRPIDIYRRVYTGINGTPMPAFEQALAQEPETMWNLVHYVLSIVEHREVPGIDQITADPLDTGTQSNDES